jgi:two-component system, sensor histidine kinase ChiS
MAELNSTSKSRTRALTPEILVPRLGDYLVEKKIITPDTLKAALSEQEKSRKEGGYPPQLGHILIEMGVIERAQLDQAVTEQILQLRNALQMQNQQLEKRVEERTMELQEALRKLSELSKLKANFVSNISHELRTPLTHVKGYLELIIDKVLGPLTNEQIQGLEVMRHATGRLEQLIEDLILFSATEHGQLNLHLRKQNIVDLCMAQVKRSSEKARLKKINLQYSGSDRLPLVEIDENKIGWVISQFIDNAIKFTPEGGQVILKANQENQFVVVSVTDTGMGIPSDKYKEIFEPFHQLDGSSTRKFGGTGLGLALATKIIDAHSTVIRVESEVGKGSCFEFVLKAVSE